MRAANRIGAAKGPCEVVVIGDAALDIAITAKLPMQQYATCCPGGPVQFKPGGSARNVAHNLAQLGCAPCFLGVFGDDAAGRQVRLATTRAGVDLSAVRVCPEEVTTHCVLVNDCDGENFCCVGEQTILRQLTPDYLQSQQHRLQRAALIIANTSLSEAALAEVFRHGNQQPVFIDIVATSQVERIFPWLSRVHTLRPSREKASRLSGLPFTSPAEAPRVADWFLQAGVRQIILSLAQQGTYYSNGLVSGWLQRKTVPVVNVTGTGDALTAGLAYGCLHAMPFVDSVRFALGCAALTLTTRENNHPGLSPETAMAMQL